MIAPTELAVVVTAEDVESGAICDSAHCPIARAAGRALAEAGTPARVVLAGGESIEARMDGHWLEYEMPEEAIDWMVDFDRLLPVRPITFTAGLTHVRVTRPIASEEETP